MELIINADDFGMCRGVNLGILESIKEGVVTSTSLMTNTIGFEHAIEIMKENRELDVGIHFVLTTCKPVSHDVKTLVNKEGKFDKNLERLRKSDKNEIKKELTAQINKFTNTGFLPTHINFHHEVHLIKQALEAAVEIAIEYEIPMRGFDKDCVKYMESKNIRNSQNVNYDFYGENLLEDDFIKILNENKDLERLEVMVHPAYLDYYLNNNSRYNIQRINELKALKSQAVKDFINYNNMNLTGFRQL